MQGNNIILLAVIVTSVIAIYTVPGGLFAIVNYNVDSGGAASDVEESINELNDFEFSIDNPISGLQEAINMFSNLLSIGWNFNGLLVLIGIPPFIANPIWIIARVILVFTMISILLRNGGIV